MPIPSFLNNLTSRSNLSPNSVPSTNPGLISGNLGAKNLDLSAGPSGLGSLNSILGGLIPSKVTPVQTQQPSYTPAPVDTSAGEAIRSGNQNNPLNQYSNEFGKYYADQNMGGYNPVAEYHRLQNERTANLLQKTGPYSVPSDVPMTADELQRVRSSGDSYYENQLAQTGGEARDVMSKLNNTVTGGVLGTLPPQTASKVDDIRKEYSDDNSTRAMLNIQNTLNQAQGVYEKNKNNTGLANGTDDYRMMFLLSNAMNPNSQVSEGDYKNAQEIMGTLPAAVQSKISAYIMKNPDGSYALSDMKKGFLTPAGREAIYQAIQDHYNETTINNEFFRKQKADLIDAYSGRQGLGDYVTRSVVNPVNVQSTKSSTGAAKSGGITWDNL